MDPSVLTCYESPFPKIRVGKEYDGGYIIVDLPNVTYTTLLAGGIEHDISFEEDFLKRYPSAKCYAFDGTIERLPKENNEIVFIRKNIGYENNDRYTTLHDLIDASDRLFVKMDIEGWEIMWLKTLSAEQMDKMEQIAIEFHSPFTNHEVEVFEKLNRSHYLVHFHGNNCCGMRLHKGVYIPNVFECTYLHKRHVKETPALNRVPIPGPLDMPNLPMDDIVIRHPPFVHL